MYKNNNMQNVDDLHSFIKLVNSFYNVNKLDESLYHIIDKLVLSEDDKKILIRRLVEILTINSKKISMYKVYYKILRLIMQIFSIIISFTMSVSTFSNNSPLSYVNLILLFILTLSTNIFFQSKIGEKYITYKKAYFKINNELWSYIMLINNYNGKTHQETINLFFTNLETIYSKEFMEILDLNKKIIQSVDNNKKFNKNDQLSSISIDDMLIDGNNRISNMDTLIYNIDINNNDINNNKLDDIENNNK